MKETTQDHFYNSIVEVLMHNLAYYLPREIVPEIVLVDLKGKISPHFFNKVSILDIYHGIGDFEVLEFNERLAKKRQRLEKTIFELLKKRKEQEATEFEYLLDKYFRQVEFYLAITNWLRLNNANYKKINKQFDLTTKGCFEMQFEAYSFHIMELISTFYQGKELNIKEVFTVEEFLKNYMQDFITRLQLAEEIVTTDPLTYGYQNEQLEAGSKDQNLNKNTYTGASVNIKQQEEQQEQQQKSNKKKKKRPMITDQEAQDFLFKTVFGVQVT